ncbi:LCP family protein [Corynebacterium sp. Q4381]|uniref:LCP family protein n=1 Tax=Corynebacterium sp. Marseille-Q4381 TaxID=3121597 RepID=UPI002FE515FD
MSTTPHSNDPRDNLGDYVLGKDGKPLVDRYGRPVHRRTDYQPRRTPHEQRNQEQRAQERPRPRQQMPAPQPKPQPRPQPRPVPKPQPRPEPRPEPRQKSRRQRRQRKAPGCLGCFTVVAAVLVLTLVGLLLADARLTRTQALPPSQVENTSGTNWLLVGSDSRTGLSQAEIDRLGTGGDIGSTRTDTIMLLHIPRTGQPTLVSIPRDSYLAIPGYGYDKVNAAFSYGGAPLLVQTVEQATGLRIDRYAEVGMGGLANVVDAIGGVEICVAEPIDDPLANLNVQPGCQKMDGATGLGYVRTRATALGDLDRVARQREFLTAVVSRTLSPAVLLNPFRLVPLMWTAPTMFTVNQSDHVWNLARIALAMRSGLVTETIPLGGFADTEVGNVMLWDEAGAQELFNRLR